MQRNRHSLFLCVVAVAVAFFGAACGAALAQEDGWLLQQNTTYSGAQSIYISPTRGGKLNTKGFSTYIAAPAWQVIMTNDRARSYCSMSFDEWTKKFGKEHLAPNSYTIRRGATGTIAGMRTVQYFVDQKLPDGRMAPTFEFWMCHDITLPSHLNYAATKLAGIPNIQGIALRVIRYNYRTGGRSTTVDTTSCQRVKIAANMLSPPPGFQRVADEMDLVMADDSGEMAEVLNSLQGGRAARPR
jgi:hypothetical protein